MGRPVCVYLVTILKAFLPAKQFFLQIRRMYDVNYLSLIKIWISACAFEVKSNTLSTHLNKSQVLIFISISLQIRAQFLWMILYASYRLYGWKCRFWSGQFRRLIPWEFNSSSRNLLKSALLAVYFSLIMSTFDLNALTSK